MLMMLMVIMLLMMLTFLQLNPEGICDPFLALESM